MRKDPKRDRQILNRKPENSRETKLKKAKARRGGCCGTSERTIEKLEARLAKLRLIKEDRNTFDVVVPPGGGAGDLLQVTDPMEF